MSIALAVAALAFAQGTKPIQPNTPDIRVPPTIELPGPAKIDELVAKPITADDAARIALIRQQSLIIAKAAVKSASGNKQSTASNLGPNLTIGSIYDDVNIYKSDPTAPVTSSDGHLPSITLRQLLFDFSHSEDLLRQASYLEDAAVYAYERSQDDLVNSVKQAFYSFVQGNSLVDAAEANVRNRQAQVALATGRLLSGLGAPADVVTAKTSLADAVVALSQARMTATQARISLAQAMGIDPRTPLVAASSSEEDPQSADMNALVDKALKMRPEMAQAVAVLKAAKAGLNSARTGNAPTLFLNVSYNGRGKNDPLASEYSVAAVTLSWTLFDSGYTGGHISMAKASVETAQAQLDLTSQAVVADVAQAYLDLKSAEQRAAITTDNVAVAREGLRLAEGRYRGGVTTFLEVTNAQSLLFTAQTNDVNAHAGIQQGRAALQRAIGAVVPGVKR